MEQPTCTLSTVLFFLFLQTRLIVHSHDVMLPSFKALHTSLSSQKTAFSIAHSTDLDWMSSRPFVESTFQRFMEVQLASLSDFLTVFQFEKYMEGATEETPYLWTLKGVQDINASWWGGTFRIWKGEWCYRLGNRCWRRRIRERELRRWNTIISPSSLSRVCLSLWSLPHSWFEKLI